MALSYNTSEFTLNGALLNEFTPAGGALEKEASASVGAVATVTQAHALNGKLGAANVGGVATVEQADVAVIKAVNAAVAGQSAVTTPLPIAVIRAINASVGGVGSVPQAKATLGWNVRASVVAIASASVQNSVTVQRGVSPDAVGVVWKPSHRGVEFKIADRDVVWDAIYTEDELTMRGYSAPGYRERRFITQPLGDGTAVFNEYPLLWFCPNDDSEDLL